MGITASTVVTVQLECDGCGATTEYRDESGPYRKLPDGWRAFDIDIEENFSRERREGRTQSILVVVDKNACAQVAAMKRIDEVWRKNEIKELDVDDIPF